MVCKVLLVAQASPWALRGNTAARQQLGFWYLPSNWSSPLPSVFGLKLSVGTLVCDFVLASWSQSSSVKYGAKVLTHFGQLGQAWNGCLHSGNAWWCHPSIGWTCSGWNWALVSVPLLDSLGFQQESSHRGTMLGIHQAIAGKAFGGWTSSARKSSRFHKLGHGRLK